MTEQRALRVSGKDVVAALRRLGYNLDNVRGSHHYLRHPTVAASYRYPCTGRPS